MQDALPRRGTAQRFIASVVWLHQHAAAWLLEQSSAASWLCRHAEHVWLSGKSVCR